ncbi:energy transducer TonB [Sediminitomix flava]|uniref:TonB family protein n=1 Tax=Sediminitomix flava TaxID=379075 RepID=A0A315YWS4_SEDFL|nr:energy transducer TonB [Sediminitomix flava]PWJ34093.1 TonB family protein [Sediminitomix flava]
MNKKSFKIFTFLILVFTSFLSNAQVKVNPNIKSTSEKTILYYVEHFPESKSDQVYDLSTSDPAAPLGGMGYFLNQLYDEVKYPKQAEKNNVSGKVLVRFIVEKDGTLSNIEVVKGLGYGCDKASIKAIKKMGNWRPAVHKGERVRQKWQLPIGFAPRKLRQ